MKKIIWPMFLLSVTLIACSCWLACNGRPGWGWFLLVGAIGQAQSLQNKYPTWDKEKEEFQNRWEQRLKEMQDRKKSSTNEKN